MRDDGPKRAFYKKKDLLVLAALVLVAGGLFLLFWPRLRPAVPVALVQVGTGAGQTTLRLPLDQNGPVEITGGRLPVQLLVAEGGVRFVNAQCPDLLCEHFGTLQNEGEWASCLPAEVFVRVE